MREDKTITGIEAIRRMRLIGKVPDAHFVLIHFTCNIHKRTGGELRKVEMCRLRKSLPDKTFHIDSDLYLTYTDLMTDEPRMCFKKLIRWVAFPTDYKLLKVNWFE